MNDERTLAQTLADFFIPLPLSEIPEQIREEGKLCILDTVGCILAGACSPSGKTFLEAERSLAGGHLTPENKARIFAYWGDIFELNDLIGGHASIGNVTASILGAHAAKASGTDMLRSVIAGLEITCRVFESITQDVRPQVQAGLCIPYCSALGAAGGISLMNKLTADQAAQAMVIACALTNWGPSEVIFGDGGTIKPFMFGGSPAGDAIRGVKYAQHGITGPAKLLESPFGLLAHCCNSVDSKIIRSVGNGVWYLAQPMRKLHACCGFTHSAIDAVVELFGKGVDFADAKEIELRVPGVVFNAVFKPKAPTTSNEARFDIKYCMSLAACGVNSILPEHSVNFEEYLPKAKGMMDKIVVRKMEESEYKEVKVFNDIYYQSIVHVTGADGTAVTGGSTAPRGAARNPLGKEGVLNKFRSLTSGKFDEAELETFIKKVLTIEDQPDCDCIYDILARFL